MVTDTTVAARDNLANLLVALGMTRIPAGAEALAITGVSIDSRHVRMGHLFVALPGERADGHSYVAGAFASGATVALVARSSAGSALVDTVAGVAPDALAPGEPVQVRVPDPLVALQCLAAARRRARPDLRVVGITGSVGKTTTKEAVAAVLAQRHGTLKSAGNQNNEIGLPLTLLGLRPDHSHAVLEMGMYDLGEIATLCEIARPQVGLVTNVGPVHLERLGTIERVTQAKGELLAALPPDGVAVLNGDDPRVTAMPTPPGVRRVLVGMGAGCDLRADNVRSAGLEGVRCVMRAADRADVDLEASSGDLRLPTLGAHSVVAALFAAAVGLLEGLSWDEVARGLASQGSGLRLVPRPGLHGSTVIDDSYNASPASTLAALDLLGELPGRRVAVLGDMLELGAYEEQGHREVGVRAAARADLLVAVGPRARRIAEEAQREGMAPRAVLHVAGVDEACDLVPALLREGDQVLVKASRSVGLEALVADITLEAGA